jgi:hypothetical protein
VQGAGERQNILIGGLKDLLERLVADARVKQRGRNSTRAQSAEECGKKGLPPV